MADIYGVGGVDDGQGVGVGDGVGRGVKAGGEEGDGGDEGDAGRPKKGGEEGVGGCRAWRWSAMGKDDGFWWGDQADFDDRIAVSRRGRGRRQ